MSQLALEDDAVVLPEHRVRAVAGVLAGFAWPARGTFERLTPPQKRACVEAARGALLALEREKALGS